MTVTLKVKYMPFNVKIDDDAGSGAKADISTWKPALPRGWFYLGPGANNGDARGVSGIVVRPTGSIRVLSPIIDWEQVWNDAGSGKSTDYALWRGLTSVEDQEHYRCLAGFFVRSHDKPSPDQAAGLVAIHRDLLMEVSPGREVWTDKGSGAHADGAVWDISTAGHLQALETGAFVPVAGYGQPPRPIYALNREKIAIVQV